MATRNAVKTAKTEIKELSPELWTDIEKLFGANGACGGCWCMSWRVQKGEQWNEIKGPLAKEKFKAMVLSGGAHGLIAYADGEPVGWCSFDKRQDYFKLDRAPSLKCDDADEVWSVPCFFIKKQFRGQNIGTALLERAVQSIKSKGGKIIEGYPTGPFKDGKKTPDAFAWTGTLRMFEKSGFKRADDKDSGKIRMRMLIK